MTRIEMDGMPQGTLVRVIRSGKLYAKLPGGSWMQYRPERLVTHGTPLYGPMRKLKPEAVEAVVSL